MCGIDGIKSFNVHTNFDEIRINYNGINFIRNRNQFYTMNGSLHLYYNNGIHNANDYHLSNLMHTYNNLYEIYQIHPDFTTINGFEFGVNIVLKNDPNYIIQRIILHKSNAGEIKSYFKEFKYSDYTIKIYNKSEITKVEPYKSENILRLEVKVKKMRFLKKHGIKIKVMSDLLELSVLRMLQKILLDVVEDLLIIDFTEVEIQNLSNKEEKMYLRYNNPNYWVNLHQNRRIYSKERKVCKNFIEKNSRSSIKSEFKTLVKHKCMEILDTHNANSVQKSWDKVTESNFNFEDKITKLNNKNNISNKDKITVLNNPKKNSIEDKITKFQTDNIYTKTDEITIKINSDFVPINEHKTDGLTHCKSCGALILNPKKNQKFCSSKEVGETQAHKCRNKDSNPRNKTKYAVNKINSYQTLFNIKDFIRADRKNYLI